MLRLATDADVNGNLIRGLRRRLPAVDLVRSVDVLGEDAPDPDVLTWAADEGRVLITNNRSTMTDAAAQLIAAGLPVPGLIVTSRGQPIGPAIDDLVLIVELMPEDEIAALVHVFLPFRG